jgi:hypothetical protein
MITDHDKKDTRCRILGHDICFHYCRTQGEDRLCRHIMNCWFESIPIESYLKKNYSEEALHTLWSPPAPKMYTLLEMIEKAKQALKEDS